MTDKKKIEIKCKGADSLPIESFENFQGNLKNLKKDQFEKIFRSIESKGFIFPVFVWNDGNSKKKIIDGHQRIYVLKEMLKKDFYLENDIPIVWIDCNTEKEAHEAVLLASSRYARIEDDSLMEFIKDYELSIEALTPIIDLPDIDLKKIDFNLNLKDFEDDEIPEIPSIPKSKEGDLIILGNHRLICGDSTNKFYVEKLFDGITPLIMVTDPPYGVNYDPEWRNEAYEKGLIHYAARSIGKVGNDDKIDWSDAFSLFQGDIAYVWHAGIYANQVAESIVKSGFCIRSQIIWGKTTFAISRGHYHWQHEPCWYAVRKGKQSHWCGDRSQSTIWKIKDKKTLELSDEDLITIHSTQKPVECMGRPIRNHGKKGDVVYDPFCGSGTTIIAAEQLERRCFAIELDPAYCDVIIDRWEKLTGKKAEVKNV